MGLASRMNRTRSSVYDVYRITYFRNVIHCILVQYLAGTLDSDPRENLLKVVEEHMRIRHIEERPFSCSSCGQSFPTKQRLQQHMKIHEEVKQYKCEICERRFTLKGHLKTHMNIHTGERPYKCEEHGCNAKFSQLIQLKNHKAKHHKKS